MNKSLYNKKKYHFLFFLMVTISFFLCCCKKEEEKSIFKDVSPDILKNISLDFKNFIFDYTTGYNSSGIKLYIPSSLQVMFRKPILKDGDFYSTFELIFPDKIDIIISEKYKDVYDCYSDDGSWVDRVFFSLEEERIGDELQKMEDVLTSGLYAPDEESAAAETENKVEQLSVKEFRTIDNTLGFMEFGKEIFIPQKQGNGWVFINAFEDNITRTFYDNLFRCYGEEKWKIGSEEAGENGIVGKENEELKKVVKTEFYEDSYKPRVKTITTYSSLLSDLSSNVQNDKKNDKNGKKIEKKQLFNEKGFMIKEEVYEIQEDTKIIQSSLNLQYNIDDKLRESNVVEYVYKDNMLEYIFNKKYQYKYNGNDIPPDFDYYEDGELKMRNLYESSDTYTSEVFFGDDFHVKTFYKDGKLIKEVFVTNGNNERLKNYE